MVVSKLNHEADAERHLLISTELDKVVRSQIVHKGFHKVQA